MLFVSVVVMTFLLYSGSSDAVDITMSTIRHGVREYASDQFADPATGVGLYRVPQFQAANLMLGTNGLFPLNEQLTNRVENKIFARGNIGSKPRCGKPRNRITRRLGSGGKSQSDNSQESAFGPTLIESCADAAQRVEEIRAGTKLILKHKDHEKLPILYKTAALASRKKHETIGQQKDAQAFFKEAIETARQSRDHNYAENLRYVAKKYAKAWGKLHAQFLGIDNKNKAKEGPLAPPIRASDSPYHLSIQPHELFSELPKHNEVPEITVADRLQPMTQQEMRYHNHNQDWRKNQCAGAGIYKNQILNRAAAFVSGNKNELNNHWRPSHRRRSSLSPMTEKRDTTFDAGAEKDRCSGMGELGRSRIGRRDHQGGIFARGLTKSKPEDAASDNPPRSRSKRFRSRPSPPRATAETDKSTSPKEAYFPDDPTKYGSFLQKETERFRNLRIAQKSMLKQKTSQTVNVLRGYAGLRSLKHNQRVGEIKDIHNTIRLAIADYYKDGNHAEAERLKYMLKQFGSAWGQHHGLLIGIDKKGKEEIHQYLNKVFGDVNKQLLRGQKSAASPRKAQQAQQNRDPKSIVRLTPDQTNSSLGPKRQRLDDQRVASRISMSRLPTIPEDAKHTNPKINEARSPRGS